MSTREETVTAWKKLLGKAQGADETREGTVQSIADDGTAWVLLAGDLVPSPCKLEASCRVGDSVMVRVTRKGRASVTGNRTDPSASSRALAAAQATADEASQVANATNQHFWDDSNGAHVTDMDQGDWLDGEDMEFPDLSDLKPYHNLLMNSLGILIRRAHNNLVSITKSAITFFDGLGNAASNVVASFGANGAQIGKSNSTHVTIDADSLDIEDGSSNVLATFSNSGVTFNSYYDGQLDYDVSLVPYGTDVKREWGSAVETLGVGGYKVQTTAGVGMPGANGRNSLPLFLSGMFVQSSNALFDAVDVNVYLASRSIEAGESIGVHANINDSNYSFKVDNDGVIVLGTHTTAEENGIKLKGGGTREGWVLRTVSASTGDGDAIIIGDGGLTVVGGGESASNLLNALGVTPGTEQLHLAADNSVWVHSNCNTVANRHSWEFNTAGNLTGPDGGSYVANNGQFYADSDSLTSGTHPSSETAGRGIIFRDSANAIIGVIQPRFGTAAQGWQAVRFYAQRSISGAAKYNILDLRIDDDGNQVVYTNNAAAWRTALGLGTAATHADTDYADASHSHSEYFSSTVNRTANTVLAAPNGSAGHASFRRLAMADLVSSFNHNTSHVNISVATSEPTAVNTTGWNYEVYSDGEVHAWGTFMRTVTLTTKLGDGFYWNSTLLYLALPVKAKFIQSVNYSMSLGGSGGAGAYCMPGGSAHTVWSGATFYLPFYIARPISTASQTYWFAVDVWYMKA